MSAKYDKLVTVRYTNWRGETADRRLILGDIRFDSTEWHPKPTWLIKAFDVHHPAKIWKDFDLLKCDFVRADLCDPTQDERVQALVDAAERLADLWDKDATDRIGPATRQLRAALRDLEQGKP